MASDEYLRPHFKSTRVDNVVNRIITPTLLRNMPLYNHKSSDNFLSIMKDKSLPSMLSYAASVQYDIVTLSPGANVMCVDTMRPSHCKVVRSAFFVHTVRIKDPVAMLLSKALPTKCSTRMSADVWESGFKPPAPGRIAKSSEAKDRIRLQNEAREKKELEYTLQEWILVSFLGGYHHCCAASRPVGRIREMLYMIFGCESSVSRPCSLWFYGLRHTASRVLNFAIRDYLVFAIYDIPALRIHVEHLFRVDDFRDITCTAMNAVRTWLSELDPDRLEESFRYAKQLESDTAMWLKKKQALIKRHALFVELSELVDASHDKLLKIAFDRSQCSLEHVLKSVRKDVPLRSLCGPRTIIQRRPMTDEEYATVRSGSQAAVARLSSLSTIEEGDDGSGDEDMKDVDVAPVVDLNEHADSDDARTEERLALTVNPVQRGYTDYIARRFFLRDQRKLALTKRKSVGLKLEQYVSRPHLDALTKLCTSHTRHMITRLDYVLADTIKVCVNAFGSIAGVSDHTIKRIDTICNNIRMRCYSANNTVIQLTNLKQTEPYAYSLLQTSVDLVSKTVQSVRIVGTLSIEYGIHQMDAIRSRLGLDKLQSSYYLEERACYFYYCKGCMASFCQIRDYKSLFKKEFNSQWKEMYYDCDADDVRCRKRRNNTPDSLLCHAQTLCKIPMIGQVLRFNSKLMMLCPQCAYMMVIDPVHCGTNEKGMICCRCSIAEREKRSSSRRLILSRLGIEYGQLSVRCLKCASELTNSDKIFCYGKNVFLCWRHHSNYLATVFSKYEASVVGELTTEQTRTFLLEQLKKQDQYFKRKRVFKPSVSGKTKDRKSEFHSKTIKAGYNYIKKQLHRRRGNKR